MDYATEREKLLHKTLVQHLMRQHIQHETEPETEQVLAVYNTWPERYLCDGVKDIEWVLKFIRRVFRTNARLWVEALKIDGFI